MIREQCAARTWFLELLQGVEDASPDLRIKVVVWYTGANKMNNKSAVTTKLFDLSSYAYLEKTGCDLITGIKRSNFNLHVGIGRPDWDVIFTKMAQDHPKETDIGVFYCGAASLRAELVKLCSRHSTVETSFKFHSEEFVSW
jgi:hypothetical protein